MIFLQLHTGRVYRSGTITVALLHTSAVVLLHQASLYLLHQAVI